jgi:tryptophanyl-tRNA synthetase
VANILMFRAHLVPVGEDQLPHIELTRETARRFNRDFGAIFPEPEALLGGIPRLVGTREALQHGTERGRTIAQETMEMVRDALDLNYFAKR